MSGNADSQYGLRAALYRAKRPSDTTREPQPHDDADMVRGGEWLVVGQREGQTPAVLDALATEEAAEARAAVFRGQLEGYSSLGVEFLAAGDPPPRPPDKAYDGLCRHCKDRKACRPRGLCWTCYYTPAVQVLYPSLSKFASNGGWHGKQE